MARVGHKDSKTTNQIYTHVTKSMEQAVLDALDTVALNRKKKFCPLFAPWTKKEPIIQARKLDMIGFFLF